MQKISDSTGTANALGEYTEGNPGAGVDATLIKAPWLNAIQRELINLINGAGMPINPSDDLQVFKAVLALAGAAADFLKLINRPDTIDGYGLKDAMRKGAGGLATVAPSVVGKVADLPGTQFFFTTGETTDVPPGFVYSIGLHIQGPDGASVDFFSSVVSEEYCIRRNYPENPTPARRLWTSANFDPASKAPLLNPEFTGNNVRVPNVPAGANDTRAANAAFVRAAIAELVASSPAALDTLNELAAALGNDPNFATSMNNALAGKASTASVTTLTQVVSSKADQQATANALSVLTQSVGSKADQAATNAALAGKFDKAGGTISGATTVATGAQGNNIPGLTVYNPGQANAYATLMLSTSISGAYIAHATASNTVYIRNHASGYADIDAGDIYSFGSRCHTADSFSKPVVGGWIALERVATLPAGGTWAYQLLTFNSGGQVQGSSVGIVPGGTTLGTTYSGGFAWRISP